MSPETDSTRTVVGGPPSLGRTQDGAPAGHAEPEPPGAGTRVGRYVLLDPLGSGGMAVVHLAYDPKLRRNVAIKLMRTRRGREEAQDKARLVREAQALAQVSHPHLVQVHDVGTWGDQVFLAMEYVRGASLSQWLRKPHRWPVAVQAVLAAGRGLAAAHDAGLVHRDFKPSNVLMGDDGRVRVADFGLARLDDGELPEAPAVAVEVSGLAIASTLTEVGTMLGTPAYMAPEQHTGDKVDARSDQYALCATLYEAVYGVRPFPGNVASALLRAKLDGPPPPPPRAPRVPAALRRAIARGLAPLPDDRYPTVHALLDELEQGLQRRRHGMQALGAIASLVAVGTLGYALSHRAPRSRCEPPAAPAAWDDARREAVRAAFAQVAVAHGRDALELAVARLDDYAAEWVGMQHDACEATHVRGEQSDELLDLRVACLQRRAAELEAVTSLLGRADADVVDRAVELVARLTPVATCADGPALRAAVPPPEDPRVAAEVEALQLELDAVEALIHAGKTADAVALARPLVERARATGYAPLHARCLLALANALEPEDPPATEPHYREAIVAAAEGKDDALQARAFTELVHAVGHLQARTDEGLSLSVGAEAAVARAGGSPLLRAELEIAVGSVEWASGRYEQAIERYERGQALIVEAAGPDDPRLRIIINNHGVAMLSLGRLEEAREQFLRSRDHARRTFGAQHPYVADSLLNLGLVHAERGEGAAARAYLDQALAILQGMPNQNRARIASVLTNTMVAATQQGDLAGAQTLAQQARAELEAVHGAEHPRVAAAIDGLGTIAMARADLPLASLYFEEALALLARTLGPTHPQHAMVALHLGQVRVSQKRPAEGAPLLDAARVVLRTSLDPDHNAVLTADAAWAEAELERGRPEVARPLLERVAERVADPLDHARATFALARALVATDGDPARARALADQAEAFYAERGMSWWQKAVTDWRAASNP